MKERIGYDPVSRSPNLLAVVVLPGESELTVRSPHLRHVIIRREALLVRIRRSGRNFASKSSEPAEYKRSGDAQCRQGGSSYEVAEGSLTDRSKVRLATTCICHWRL